MENTQLYWIHALTPLHVGVGFGLGFIDLPVIREKITNWPIVPGSAVKGVLADHFDAATADKRKSDTLLRAAFGIAGEDHSNSGSLVFTDARLACLPVRSLYGTFAWVTSPLALQRLARDLEAAAAGGLPAIPEVPEAETHLARGSALKGPDGKVYLSDLDFTAREASPADDWAARIAAWVFPGEPAWAAEYTKRFAILPDASFNFLCETGTEVTARVRIDPERKSVARGQLWYEEYLPAETILAGLVWCDRVFAANGLTPAQLLERFCSGTQRLQIGGKATIGKGRVRCVFPGGNHA